MSGLFYLKETLFRKRAQRCQTGHQVKFRFPASRPSASSSWKNAYSSAGRMSAITAEVNSMPGSFSVIVRNKSENGYLSISSSKTSGCSTMFHASAKLSTNAAAIPVLRLGNRIFHIITSDDDVSSDASSNISPGSVLMVCVRKNTGNGANIAGRIHAPYAERLCPADFRRKL